MLIPILQLTTALFTEIISLILIAESMHVMDVVMNFVALAIIADIDNMFADASQDKHMKRYIEENPDDYQPILFKTNTEFKDRPLNNKIMYCMYKMLDFNHKVWYFYLFPFMCIVLNFYAKTATNCERLDLDEACPANAFGIVSEVEASANAGSS